MQPGHADVYDNLRVQYIPGRNPDLILRDDNGSLLETIDLSPVSRF